MCRISTQTYCTKLLCMCVAMCVFIYCNIYVALGARGLIKSYCTSFYCGYLWSDYKAKTFSKLRVAFNNVYKRVLGLPM